MRRLLTGITVAVLAFMPLTTLYGEPRPPEPSFVGASGGSIMVVHHNVRPLPANTTELRFTGLSADQTQTFFTASKSPRRRILLRDVSPDVKILKIEYLAGSTLVGLFEGFVRVHTTGRTLVRDPA